MTTDIFKRQEPKRISKFVFSFGSYINVYIILGVYRSLFIRDN